MPCHQTTFCANSLETPMHFIILHEILCLTPHPISTVKVVIEYNRIECTKCTFNTPMRYLKELFQRTHMLVPGQRVSGIQLLSSKFFLVFFWAVSNAYVWGIGAWSDWNLSWLKWRICSGVVQNPDLHSQNPDWSAESRIATPNPDQIQITLT